jgi:hypothetical protein
MNINSKLAYSLFLCLIYSLTASAQVEKGRLRLGGAFSASFQKNNSESRIYGGDPYSTEQKNTSISISPLGGIFLMDGFELGINPSINWSANSAKNSADEQRYDAKSINFLIGPYVNYYIGSGENGKPFVGLNPKIGWGNGEIDRFDFENGGTYAAKTETKTWSVKIVAGYAIFLNDSYLLSFFGGYEYSNNNSEEEDSVYQIENKVNMFTLGVSISTTFKRPNE